MAMIPPMMAMSSWMMSRGLRKIFLSGNTISASAMGISSKRFMFMLRRSSAYAHIVCLRASLTHWQHAALSLYQIPL